MARGGAQDDYFAVISGERRDIGASLMRAFLWLLSLLYRAAMAARRVYYRYAATRVELPVVSVGNLTVGGTGKTPLVALLARRLAAMGHRPLVVSRGYKRTGPGPGDEAAAIRGELPPSAAHVESADRIAAIRSAIEASPRDVVVLDDGFQHIRLRRDLDVVTVDAARPFGPAGPGAGGRGHCLPRGLLREPVSALARAHAVVITRCDQVEPEALGWIEARIRKHLRPGALLLHAEHVPAQLVGLDGKTEPVEALWGADVFAFCGLGNPEAFRRTLESLGARVAGRRWFPDHHHYTERDVADIIEVARATGGDAPSVPRIVTTTKDFVKVASGDLARAWPAGMQPTALAVEIRFREGGDALDGLLRRVVGQEQ